MHKALFAAILLFFAWPSFAQDAGQRRADTGRELVDIRQQMEVSVKRREQLRAEIDALEKDRVSINKALIDASSRARALQGEIGETEEQLANLNVQQDDIKGSLQGRRGVLAEVLGALQRMGTNPPPAILVTPDDALASVRSAILLGAVVPQIRAEADLLLAELTELQRIGNDLQAGRDNLAGDLGRLADDEARMEIILEEKKKLTADARKELADQSAKAAELAARQVDLTKLIEELEKEISLSRQSAENARKADEERLAREKAELDAGKPEPKKPDFSDMARIAPAMSFEDAKGLLQKPVDGVEVLGFGQSEPLGEPHQGLSIATRNEARVTSPADGWVVYSGPFRSYGQLLILNAGNGYHVVLAGMEKMDVALGQFVLAAEPVGSMGARRIAGVDATGVESSRPVLYVEFRKDGKSIDPSPWWSDTALKRPNDDS